MNCSTVRVLLLDLQNFTHTVREQFPERASAVHSANFQPNVF